MVELDEAAEEVDRWDTNNGGTCTLVHLTDTLQRKAGPVVRALVST